MRKNNGGKTKIGENTPLSRLSGNTLLNIQRKKNKNEEKNRAESKEYHLSVQHKLNHF